MPQAKGGRTNRNKNRGGDGMLENLGLNSSVSDLVQSLSSKTMSADPSNSSPASTVDSSTEVQEGGRGRGRVRVRGRENVKTNNMKGAVNIAPFVSALALLGTRIVNDSRFVNRKNKVNPFGTMFKNSPKSSPRGRKIGGNLDGMGAPVNTPMPLEGTGAGQFLDSVTNELGLTGGRKRTPIGKSPAKKTTRGRSKSPAKKGAKTRSKSPVKRGRKCTKK